MFTNKKMEDDDLKKPNPVIGIFDRMREEFGKRSEADESKPFTIKFKRRKFVEDSTADELNTSIVNYHIENYTEQNKDLYFIKIVAGALKKKFTDLIVIENKERLNNREDRPSYDSAEDSDDPDDIKRRPPYYELDIAYRQQDDLQSAWAQALEHMKLMLGNNRCNNKYSSSVNFHQFVVLKHESLLVAVALYVAYLMTGTSKWLVMKYNTEKELIDQQQTKKKLYLDVMRELHRATGDVRKDLIDKWFPSYNFYFC